MPRPRQKVHSGPRRGRIHDRVLRALGDIGAGQAADKVVAHVLRRADDLGSNERRRVREWVFTAVRSQVRVDYQLRRAINRKKKGSWEEMDASARLGMRLMGALTEHGVSPEEVSAVDPALYRRYKTVWPTLVLSADVPSSNLPWDVKASIPSWFKRALLSFLDEEAAKRLAFALNERAPLSLRSNVHMQDRTELQSLLTEELGTQPSLSKVAEQGLLFEEYVDVRKGAFQEGRFEVQDEGSQLVVDWAPIPQGAKVLDACSGSGGKTLALAARPDVSKVVSVELDENKVAKQRERLARWGGRAQIETSDLLELPKSFYEQFDFVLLDAPCTQTGVLRRSPDVLLHLKPEEVGRFGELQRQLLTAASLAVKPGGVLAYVTCSILHEENEAVVHSFVSRSPQFELVPSNVPAAKEFQGEIGYRIGPGPTASDPDGFFAAYLRRADS